MPRDPKGKAPSQEEVEEAPARPLSYGWFGTLLIESGRLFARHWKAIMVPFVAMMIVLALAYAGASWATGRNPTDATGAATYLLQVLGVPLLGAWVVARAAIVLDERADGSEEMTFRSAGERTKNQRAHIGAAAMLAAVLTFFLVMALGQLGYIVALNFFLGPPLLIHAIAIEGESFADGWARAKELMRGEVARVLVYLLAVSLAVGLIQLVVIGGVIVGLQQVDTGTVVELGTSGVAFVLVYGLALTFMACVGVAAYRELKQRRVDKAR